jgi:hypothetical protein
MNEIFTPNTLLCFAILIVAGFLTTFITIIKFVLVIIATGYLAYRGLLLIANNNKKNKNRSNIL